MPITITQDELFDTQCPDYGPNGSNVWNREIFKRAYCGGGGPFDKVCQRLQRGFSVLVYLPGNCMTAAAEVAQDVVGRAPAWVELGRPLAEAQTMADVWRHSTSMFQQITNWISGDHTARPRVIFHNLDLLGDDHGGLIPGDEAKTALFYLIDSVRSGVVLGLSDREAGELPAAIRRTFSEEIWLDEISVERFARLIPRALGERVKEKGQISEGAAWLIGSRLRWTDPIRAVNIMISVVEKSKTKDLHKVLADIMEATRTVEFLSPSEIEPIGEDGQAGRPTGFELATIELLQTSIIQPFKAWTRFSGNEDECQRELRKLPPGLILYGPPGTGKTRLARWVAKSVNMPVRLVSAADLKRADWGLTEKLVKDLFRAARRAAPCVVVLDDADDLLPDRASTQGSVASAERGIVNAFLQELEGWHGRLEGILVILTTNRYAELDAAAKQRLHVHLRIPYPLDSSQVSEVVKSVAASYNLNVAPVENELATYFLGPRRPTSIAMSTADERRALDSNLFSPREIANAMRILIGQSNTPTSADVARMKSYLDRQAKDGAALAPGGA